MKNGIIRRIACVAALIGLGAASVPQLEAAPPAAATATAAATTGAGAAVTHAGVQSTIASRASGRGWGSMIGCAACIVGAGLLVAGGPGAILLAINAPGSAIGALACAASCYEAI
jgi:hypothetical protein